MEFTENRRNWPEDFNSNGCEVHQQGAYDKTVWFEGFGFNLVPENNCFFKNANLTLLPKYHEENYTVYLFWQLWSFFFFF